MYFPHARTRVAPLLFLTAAMSLLTPNRSIAELKAMEDGELSNITGQAMIAISQNSYAEANNNVRYTRIDLGLEIETQLNAELLELGRYNRNDPLGESKEADIILEDFALGTIYDASYYQNNPRVAMPLKSDGSNYSDGEIVPFKITDPFIEFAIDEVTGEPIGVRVGLGGAEGILSANIKSLTGDLNLKLLDRGEGLKAASSSGNIFDRLVVLLAPYLTSGDPIQSKAVLVDKYGNPDPIRATMAGAPNGEKIIIKDTDAFTRFAITLLGPTLSSAVDIQGKDVIITVQDCAAIGITVCFELDQFKSLSIGEFTDGGNGRNYLTGPEKGTFLSFQTKQLKWLNDVQSGSPVAEQFIEATQGAYLNVPNGITLNLKEAIDGIPRARTEFIDRGVGLF